MIQNGEGGINILTDIFRSYLHTLMLDLIYLWLHPLLPHVLNTIPLCDCVMWKQYHQLLWFSCLDLNEESHAPLWLSFTTGRAREIKQLIFNGGDLWFVLQLFYVSCCYSHHHKYHFFFLSSEVTNELRACVWPVKQTHFSLSMTQKENGKLAAIFSNSTWEMKPFSSWS